MADKAVMRVTMEDQRVWHRSLPPWLTSEKGHDILYINHPHGGPVYENDHMQSGDSDRSTAQDFGARRCSAWASRGCRRHCAGGHGREGRDRRRLAEIASVRALEGPDRY